MISIFFVIKLFISFSSILTAHWLSLGAASETARQKTAKKARMIMDFIVQE